MLGIKPEYLIQMNFKSGLKMRLWCQEFTCTSSTCNYVCSTPNTNMPLKFQFDEVESFWQKGVRFTFFNIPIPFCRWTSK